MCLTMSYSDGRRIDAVVLAVSSDVMRMAVPGCDDTVELRRQQNQWLGEDGDPVELEAWVAETDPVSMFEPVLVFEEVRPRAMAAGGSVM